MCLLVAREPGHGGAARVLVARAGQRGTERQPEWILTSRDHGVRMNASAAWLWTFLEFAVPLALVVSLALRWVYLRVVRRSMLRPVVEMAAPADEASPAPQTFPAPADPPSQRLEIVPAATPARDAVRAAWRGPWIAVAVHAVAGLAYALAMTSAWAWAAMGMVGGIPAVHPVGQYFVCLAAGDRGRPGRAGFLARHVRCRAHLRSAVLRQYDLVDAGHGHHPARWLPSIGGT